MIKILLMLIIFMSFQPFSYSQERTAEEKLKTEITGKIMEINNAGKETVVKGNAKIVRGNNTITADKMTYYKENPEVKAAGNVNFAVKNEDGSIVRAKSQNAVYNTKDYSGRLWNGSPVINYTLKDSTETVTLYADNIKLNKNFESAKATDNVKIISSSGTIISDNAFLNRNNNSLIMTKDKNKPEVHAVQADKKADFNADKISLFYDKKIVIMNGNVEGKIIMDSLEEKK